MVRLRVYDPDSTKLSVKLDDKVALRTAESLRVSGDYEDLSNKPSINGVELVGNKTTEDLGIEAGVSSWNGQTGDVTYTAPVQSVNGQTGVVLLDAEDVGALPDDTAIPTRTSDLTNDSGFLTAETDPTVPAWAKAENPPEYELTYDESVSVGYAKVGEAVTGTPNYTPGGEIALTKEAEEVIGNVQLAYHLFNSKLYIDGLTITNKQIQVPNGAMFTGTGVKFEIKEAES